MGAIARNNHREKRSLPLRSIVSRLRTRNTLLIATALAILVLIGVALLKSPAKVEFHYADMKGCISESRVQAEITKAPIWYGLVISPQHISREYSCIDTLSIRYAPFDTVHVSVTNKKIVLGAIVQQVEPVEHASWKDIFTRERSEGKLMFFSEDGTSFEIPEGYPVPRITLLTSTATDRLGSTDVERLVRLYSVLQTLDKSTPKIDYSVLGVVRISSVTFQEAYLTLNDSWETQLRKMLAVHNYLRLRGSTQYVFDARLRDVVVFTR